MHLQKRPSWEYPKSARLDTICREENRKIRHIHYERRKNRKTSGTRFYVYG